MKKGLDTWQWLTLIGIIMTAGISVTVFAFTTFDPKGSADAVQSKLETKIDRVSDLQIQMMLEMGIQPKPPKKP